MSFPDIEACVICEDVRRELGGMSTLLGFYGLAPNVDIVFKDIKLPLDRISFFLIGGAGEGNFKISFELLTKDGTSFVKTPEGTILIEPTKRKTFLIFSLANQKFPEPGTYKIRLNVDGSAKYENTFEVLQGTEKDFIKQG